MAKPIIKVGDWELARFSLAAGVTATAPALKLSLRQEGQWLRKLVVKGIRKQAPGRFGGRFQKLAKTTIAVRRLQGFRGRKALIRSGDLIGGINVTTKNAGFTVFVGILRTAKSKGGQSLVNIAQIQEEGFGPIVIKITDKMRRFLFAALKASKMLTAQSGSGGSSGVIVINIPPRPFFQPVFDSVAKPAQIRERFLNRVAINMKGVMGKPSKKPPT